MTQKTQQLQEAIRGVCPELVIEHYKGEQEPAIELLPIGLQHILRAINKTMTEKYKYEAEHTQRVCIDDQGSIIWHHTDFTESIPTYNLTLPLDQQDPETIDFLHSIICKA